MNELEDGGPAFPRPGSDWEAAIFPGVGEPEKRWANHLDGMSLRDWFAGRAMQAILANETIITGTIDRMNWVLDCTSKAAYKLADAMLKARNAKDK